MARTTGNLVGEIIELDEEVLIAPFIVVAHALVNEIAVESGHTEERLRLIETWLAAHFYTVRDPQAIHEQAGAVGVTYQSRVDLYLATSHYGQTAMTLDTSGLLRGISKGRRVATVTWLGNDEHRGVVNDT